MRVVEFEYDIGQEVMVKPIGMRGTVDSLSFDQNGMQYRVVYWNDGHRQSVWMYSWELKGA